MDQFKQLAFANKFCKDLIKLKKASTYLPTGVCHHDPPGRPLGRLGRRHCRPAVEEGERGADRVVVHGQGDGVALGGRMDRHLVAPQGHVRPSEVAEGGQARHRGSVGHIAAVTQDLHVRIAVVS